MSDQEPSIRASDAPARARRLRRPPARHARAAPRAGAGARGVAAPPPARQEGGHPLRARGPPQGARLLREPAQPPWPPEANAGRRAGLPRARRARARGDGAHRPRCRGRSSSSAIAPSCSSATSRRCSPTTGRARGWRASARAGTPEQSLFVLRHAMTNLLEVARGLDAPAAGAVPPLLRAPRLAQREISHRRTSIRSPRSSSARSSTGSRTRRCSS